MLRELDYSTFLFATGPLGLYVAYKIALAVIHSYASPLRDVPGPKSVGWLCGSYGEVPEPEGTRLQEHWVQIYGHTYVCKSPYGVEKLVTTDAKALSHVLSQNAIYQKSDLVKLALSELLGQGLLFVEGAKHRQQRRIMTPAFGPIQVRKFTEIFVDKSIELRDIWLFRAAQTVRGDGKVKIDAFNWLNKVTLDIIGLAGFNYDFEALRSPDDQRNELGEAVRKMFAMESLNSFFLLQVIFPPLRFIPTAHSRQSARSLETIRRIGTQMIAEKKAAVLAGASNVVEKKDVQGHDLLSLLIKSNMAIDQAESGRMSDDEILSQLPTFIVAGHETTSTAIAWTLFALATLPDVQIKLRAEIYGLATEAPSMDELNDLPYLDGVIREALRLYAPVSETERVTTQDDVIPLGKPFIDKKGVLRHEIRVRKGDVIMVPIRIINRSEEFWGEDAEEFKPERWQRVPDSARTIPNVWGNTLTFIAGAHACIGYRFSVVEMKAIVFTIVRSFELELALSAEDIVRKSNIVGRPALGTNPLVGPTLPLLLRPVLRV